MATDPFDPEAPLPGAPDPWASSSMPEVRAEPPYLMTQMIAAEPALAERLVRSLTHGRGAQAVDRVAGMIHDAVRRGFPVVTTGCGTSEHAAIGAAHSSNPDATHCCLGDACPRETVRPEPVDVDEVVRAASRQLERWWSNAA